MIRGGAPYPVLRERFSLADNITLSLFSEHLNANQFSATSDLESGYSLL